MRLGLDPCRLQRGSRAEQAYGDGLVFERHRHRYEVNNRYRRRLEDAGLVCSGTSPDGRLVEIIELPDHPWFVAGQFHPEFRSRPTRPHPLFREFVGAATALADAREPVTRVERAPAKRVPRDGAGRDEAATPAPAAARRPDGVEWRATRGEGEVAHRPTEPAARRPTVDLREQEAEEGRTAPPEGSGEPRRGAPVDRPEGSGEPRRGAPVDREGPDPSVYRRGDSEPEPEAPVEVRAVPTDPVPAGEPHRP
jgi:hypothetical protein